MMHFLLHSAISFFFTSTTRRRGSIPHCFFSCSSRRSSPSPSPCRSSSSIKLPPEFPSALSPAHVARLVSTHHLQLKIDLFTSLGLPLLKVGRLGRLFTVKFDTLQSRLCYLNTIGISAEDIRKMVRRHPYILGVDSQKCIKPALLFLENEMGLSKESVWKFVVTYPYIICLSTQKIAQKMEFLEKLGLDPKSPRFSRNVAKLSTLRCELLQERFDWFVARGISREGVIKLTESAPTVLTCRQDITGPKIDYLQNVLNRDIEELVRCPAFLVASLQQRLKPRFSVVDQLVKRGLLKATYSLSSVLSCSDEVFKRRFTGKLYREETPEIEVKALLEQHDHKESVSPCSLPPS